MKIKTGFSNPIRVWRFNGQSTESIKSYKGNELSDQILHPYFSFTWWVPKYLMFLQKVSHRRYLHFCLSGAGVLWVWEFDISEVPRECIKTNIRSETFLKKFSSKDNFWLKGMKTQNCTIYEHGLFWCILMIRFARLVKFYGILVAMHQQRNTQRLTGRNTQRLNWQFGKLQNLLQW